MAQKLSLPFGRPVLSAAYKHPLYRAHHGYTHYGWDMGCDEPGYAVLSPGAGRVVAAGMDGWRLHGAGAGLGNCIVLILQDVQCRDGTVRDIACRMFHLASIAIKAGQTVRRGDKLGEYGDTGAGKWGRHLHIEFDTDTQYPAYAVGVAGSGRVIKCGTVDSTVDPARLFCRAQGQTVRGCPADDGRSWYDGQDLALPLMKTAVCPTCGKEM